MATYELIGRNKITLTLTRAEACGFAKLAGDGAVGILADAVSTRDWIGPAASVAAACRALRALDASTSEPLGPDLFRMRNKKKGRLSPPSVSRRKGSGLDSDQP